MRQLAYEWRYRWNFGGDVCHHQDDAFPQEVCAYFCRTMTDLILHSGTRAGLFVCARARLNCLPAVQICLVLKMYGASWRGESDNNHGLSSRWNIVFSWDGHRFVSQNRHNYHPQFRNYSEVSRKMMQHIGKHACPWTLASDGTENHFLGALSNKVQTDELEFVCFLFYFNCSFLTFVEILWK